MTTRTLIQLVIVAVEVGAAAYHWRAARRKDALVWLGLASLLAMSIAPMPWSGVLMLAGLALLVAAAVLGRRKLK